MQFHAKYVPAIETSYKEKKNVDNKRKNNYEDFHMLYVGLLYFQFFCTYCNMYLLLQ